MTDPATAARTRSAAEPAVFSAPEWVPVQAFLDHLRQAALGVVRVSIGRAGCTGWLITDTLVVVPQYALSDDPAAVFECRLPGEPGPVPTALAYLPPAGAEALPALIRLPEPFPGRALALATESPLPGEPVLLLHYPGLVGDLQLSQGYLRDGRPDQLSHDVPAAPGSGGAPVISAGTGKVLGIHWGTKDVGFGSGLAAVLAALRDSPAWPEIAAAHRLAEVGTTPRPGAVVPPEQVRPPPVPSSPSPPVRLPEALLRAAITWTLDPEELSPADRELIRPLIEDPDEPQWSLPTEERRRLIGSADSLDALRAAHDPTASPGPGAATISRILTGPPYDLGQVPDDDLPYWLQAVSWFDRLLPDLPRPSDVHRVLVTRRIRGRLRDSTSPRLWGRDGELSTLWTWFAGPDAPPMVVTGIGGIGKSALVARFALDLPVETVILWLDFDRADLSPDNAVSVVAALVEQLGVQRDGFTMPQVDAANWRSAATSLSAALSGTGALLVFDGFEVAQHVQRHEELWEVMEEVVGRTNTRVLISGRAEVPGLRLVGRAAVTLPLSGIPDEAATGWLAERSVTDPEVAGRVLRAARGLPLLLKLSLRLLEAGGDIPATLDRLPKELVSGFLYRRILNRVGTPKMRRLARDALVLRRLTRDIVSAVLADRIPAGLGPDQVFSLLARELALVEAAAAPTATADPSGGWLRLRPEVRVATLRLLEIEDPERTRIIDQRAADWYAGPDVASAGTPRDRAAAAAERVYHLARIGDGEAAEAAWVEGCEEFLAGADEEIPEAFPAARDWLRERVSGVSGDEHGAERALATWEEEALLRIRDVVGRGLDRTVPAFLRENTERSPQSPLLVYDAWTLRTDGRFEQARALLRDAPAVPGPVGWGRTIVAARTAALNRDPAEADRLLAGIDLTASFIEPDHALAVTAARIRLAVDLEAEAQAILVGRGSEAHSVLTTMLAPWDLVLPTPRGFLGRGEYHSFPPVPEEESDAAYLARALDGARRQSLRRDVDAMHSVSLLPDAEPLPSSVQNSPPAGATLTELVARLVELSVRRWRFAVHSTFLADVRRSVESSRFADQIRLSLAGTLAAFWSAEIRYREGMPLVEVARRAADGAGATHADPDALTRLDAMRAALESVVWADPKSALRSSLPNFLATGPFLWSSLPPYGWEDGSNCALLLALGPDPLEELERRVLGRPELKAK